MSRGQFALLGAVLGAIVVGVFIIAYEANVSALTGGSTIRQDVRGVFMLVGAGAGFILFGLFGGTRAGARSDTPDEQPPAG